MQGAARALAAVGVGSMVFILWVEASMVHRWSQIMMLGVFGVWNCVPAAVAIWALFSPRFRSSSRFAGAVVFAVVASSLPALFHVAWLANWRGTATGSSTAGVAFVFVPGWSLLFGGGAALATWGIAVTISSARRGG
jgi:hypothetical protein